MQTRVPLSEVNESPRKKPQLFFRIYIELTKKVEATVPNLMAKCLTRF